MSDIGTRSSFVDMLWYATVRGCTMSGIDCDIFTYSSGSIETEDVKSA